MAEKVEKIGPRYIGDGVYAEFDGYHIQIRVGSHENETLVYLEPEVLSMLNEYAKAINAFYNEDIFK